MSLSTSIAMGWTPRPCESTLVVLQGVLASPITPILGGSGISTAIVEFLRLASRVERGDGDEVPRPSTRGGMSEILQILMGVAVGESRLMS